MHTDNGNMNNKTPYIIRICQNITLCLWWLMITMISWRGYKYYLRNLPEGVRRLYTICLLQTIYRRCRLQSTKSPTTTKSADIIPPKKKSHLLTTKKNRRQPTYNKTKEILERTWCPRRVLLVTQLIHLICLDSQILLNPWINLYGLLQKKYCIHSLCPG